MCNQSISLLVKHKSKPPRYGQLGYTEVHPEIWAWESLGVSARFVALECSFVASGLRGPFRS